MVVEGRRDARYCEAFDGNAGAGEFTRLVRAMPGTPPRPSERNFGNARTGGKLRIEHRKIAFTSSGASVCGWRDRPIRKKVIRRNTSVFRKRFNHRNVLLHLLGAFPLLHQPARQHGGGIFLDPKVEKRADLLAEISSMAEAREF